MGWNEKKNAQHLEIQWQCVQDPHENDFTMVRYVESHKTGYTKINQQLFNNCLYTYYTFARGVAIAVAATSWEKRYVPNKVLRPGQYSPECLFHPSPPVLRHLRKSDATKPLEAQGCPKMCWVQLIILLLLRRPEHRRKTLKMFEVCIVASQQCELPGTTSYFFIQSLTKFKPGISRRRGTFWLMWLCNMTLHVIAQIWPSPAWSITKQFPLHQEKRGFCAQFASGIQPCCVPWWKNGTVQQNKISRYS